MNRVKLALIGCFILFCAPSVNAQDYTIAEFLNWYNNGDQNLRRLMEGDVAQMGHAFVSVNGLLELEKREKLYCQPSSISFTGAEYIGMIKSYVGNNDLLLNRRIGNPSMLLLFALRKRYPC